MRSPAWLDDWRERRRAGQGRPGEATLAELLLLPVLMAGLSLLMWFSLPSFHAALDRIGPRIDERRAAIAALAGRAADLLQAPATGCTGRVDPMPVFDEKDDAATNLEIIGPSQLRDLDVERALAGDVDLTLSGDLSLLMHWRKHAPLTNQRMTRKRIAQKLERPLGYRYVLFYETRMTEPLAAGPGGRAHGTVDVGAVLFDLQTGGALCTLGFEESIDPGFQRAEEFERFAHSELWSQARGRLLRELAAVTTRSRG